MAKNGKQDENICKYTIFSLCIAFLKWSECIVWSSKISFPLNLSIFSINIISFIHSIFAAYRFVHYHLLWLKILDWLKNNWAHLEEEPPPLHPEKLIKNFMDKINLVRWTTTAFRTAELFCVCENQELSGCPLQSMGSYENVKTKKTKQTRFIALEKHSNFTSLPVKEIKEMN